MMNQLFHQMTMTGCQLEAVNINLSQPQHSQLQRSQLRRSQLRRSQLQRSQPRRSQLRCSQLWNNQEQLFQKKKKALFIGLEAFHLSWSDKAKTG